jgi:hypothetical protein
MRSGPRFYALPPTVLELLKHALTDSGLAGFLADWTKVPTAKQRASDVCRRKFWGIRQCLSIQRSIFQGEMCLWSAQVLGRNDRLESELNGGKKTFGSGPIRQIKRRTGEPREYSPISLLRSSTNVLGGVTCTSLSKDSRPRRAIASKRRGIG